VRRRSFSRPNLPSLTFDEYEDIYRETLLCLSEHFCVGDPFMDPSGNRVCMIDGVPSNDDKVLVKWWGQEIGGDIQRLYLTVSSALH